jgi:DnaJ-class molecular chaperone
VNDIGEKIIERLQEFRDKLESGEPIEGTRLVQCDYCAGERVSPFTGTQCQCCCGTGYVRRRVNL